MAGLSFDVLRVGKKYRITNFGETNTFQIMEALDRQNYKVKDLETFELYHLHDLIKFGRGKDFELRELSHPN